MNGQQKEERILDLAEMIAINTQALYRVLDGTWGTEEVGVLSEGKQEPVEAVLDEINERLSRSVEELQGFRERLNRLVHRLG